MEKHKQTFSQLLQCNIDVEILDFIEGINILGCKTFQCCKGEEGNQAWIILEKNHFHKVQHIFPKNTTIEEGSYGYVLSDYHETYLNQDQVITCIFNLNNLD